MKKYKSKIVKLQNKKKFFKILKYYPLISLIFTFSCVAFGIIAALNGIWPLGGIFGGLSIASGLIALTGGAMGVDKLIYDKIENIDKEIEEIAKEDKFENQISQIYENVPEKEQNKLITKLIKNKNKKTQKIKELNPDLDIEFEYEDNVNNIINF